MLTILGDIVCYFFKTSPEQGFDHFGRHRFELRLFVVLSSKLIEPNKGRHVLTSGTSVTHANLVRHHGHHW